MRILNLEGKRTIFLKHASYLSFVSFNHFTNLQSMLRCTTDTAFLFSVSLMWAIYKFDITCAGSKLDAKPASQTIEPAHDIL